MLFTFGCFNFLIMICFLSKWIHACNFLQVRVLKKHENKHEICAPYSKLFLQNNFIKHDSL